MEIKCCWKHCDKQMEASSKHVAFAVGGFLEIKPGKFMCEKHSIDLMLLRTEAYGKKLAKRLENRFLEAVRNA